MSSSVCMLASSRERALALYRIGQKDWGICSKQHPTQFGLWSLRPRWNRRQHTKKKRKLQLGVRLVNVHGVCFGFGFVTETSPCVCVNVTLSPSHSLGRLEFSCLYIDDDRSVVWICIAIDFDFVLCWPRSWRNRSVAAAVGGMKEAEAESTDARAHSRDTTRKCWSVQDA